MFGGAAVLFLTRHAAAALKPTPGPGDAGTPLEIIGTVYCADGQPAPGAHVELWRADEAGYYDVSGDRFRTDLVLDGTATFTVKTVMPGHYPTGVRQHVHFLVRADGCKPLVTQMYFESDPDRNFTRDPLIRSRDRARSVTVSTEGGSPIARAHVDLVLETL